MSRDQTIYTNFCSQYGHSYSILDMVVPIKAMCSKCGETISIQD